MAAVLAALAASVPTVSNAMVPPAVAATSLGAVPLGSYGWPVVGRVLRPFEPPASPYATGHRGIDIEAPFGTKVVAPERGIVAFAGWIGGSLFASIDHPEGIRTTYSWLSAVEVRAGDAVARGQPFASTGHGHPDVSVPHLHFGARLWGEYIDPMLLLGGGSLEGLIRLAPLQEPAAAGLATRPVAAAATVEWALRRAEGCASCLTSISTPSARSHDARPRAPPVLGGVVRASLARPAHRGPRTWAGCWEQRRS
jgi:Peptidase family M23